VILVGGRITLLPILFYTGRKRIDVYLDKEFEGKKIAVHPNDNTATIYLQADDLIRLIKEHGNEVELSEL
jgi:Ala-tRNA(Pro) deacylase